MSAPWISAMAATAASCGFVLVGWAKGWVDQKSGGMSCGCGGPGTQQRAPRAVKLPREGKGRQTHLDLRRVERGERLDGGGLEVEHQHVVVVEVHVLLGVLLGPVGTRTGGWMV